MVVAGVWLITRRVTRHDPILTPVLVGIALGTLCGAGISLIKNAGRSLHPVTVNYLLVAGAVHRDLTRSLLCCTDHSHRLLALFFSPLAHEFTHAFRRRSPFAGTERDTSALWIDCLRHTHHRQHGSNSRHNWLVGTVVPHIARLLTGHNHQQLLPMAMCTGAILLLLTDTLARSIGTTEIPLGILTAFVGAPFFLFCCYAEVASDFACRPSCVSGLLPPSGATRRVLHPVARNNLLSVRANGCGKTTLMRSILGVIPLLKARSYWIASVQTLSHRQRAQAIVGCRRRTTAFCF